MEGKAGGRYRWMEGGKEGRIKLQESLKLGAG